MVASIDRRRYLRIELDDDEDPGHRHHGGTPIDMKTIWPLYNRSYPKWRRDLNCDTPVFHKFTDVPYFDVGGVDRPWCVVVCSPLSRTRSSESSGIRLVKFTSTKW
jgi:hypothetical protein